MHGYGNGSNKRGQVMKYRMAVGALALSFSGSLLADALEFSPGLPYIGADVYQRNVNMVQGYGSESFPKRVPQGNLYIGTWFNEYFGIEGGWMFTPHAKRVAYNDFMLLGVKLDPTPPAEFYVTNNTLTLNGSHLNIVGQIPIMRSKFRLFGSAGLSVLKIKAISYQLASDAGPTVPQIADAQKKQFASRRAIPSFGIGIIYPLSEALTVRILTRYEMTSKFKNIAGKEPLRNATPYIMSLKNNILFGLGIAHQF